MDKLAQDESGPEVAGEPARQTARPEEAPSWRGGLSVPTIIRALVLVLSVLLTTAANPVIFPEAGLPGPAPASGDCQEYYTGPYVPSGPFATP